MKKHKFYIIKPREDEFTLHQVTGYDIDGEFGVYRYEKNGRWYLVEYASGQDLGNRHSAPTRKRAVKLYLTLKDKIAEHKKKAVYQKQVERFNEAITKLLIVSYFVGLEIACFVGVMVEKRP